MQVGQTTNAEDLLVLLRSIHDTQLPTIIQRHHFSVKTVQQLKDYSAQFHLSEPEHALQIAKAAYRLGQYLPAPAGALGAWTLGNAFLHATDLVKAQAFLTEARLQYLQLGHQLEAARLGVGQVAAFAYNGKSEAALALAAEIEPILQEASQTNTADLQRLGKLLMNTGIAHELLGQYEEALLLYERQEEIAAALKDPLMLAELTNNRAHALVQLGTFREAAIVYQTAEQLFQAVDAPLDRVRLYYNYAALLTLMGHYSEARRLQDRAAQLLSTLDGVEAQQHWLTLMRATLDLQARWPITTTLIEALYSARQAFQQHGPAFAAGLAWVVVGRCHLRGQEWSQAEAAFSQAQQHAQRHADRMLTYRVLHGIGELADGQNQIAEAITAYQAAIQQIEVLRSELQIETLRADFLNDKLVVYQNLTQLYVRTQQLAAAFEVIERAKARLLTEKLTFRLSQEAAKLTLPENEQLQQLTQLLCETLQQLETLYRQARLEELQQSDGLSQAPTIDTASALRSLEEQAQTLTHQIQRQQPLFSAYATGEPASLTKIQSHLHTRILLQYYIAQESVWVFVIDHTGILAHHQLAALTDVEAARQGLTNAIEQALELSVRFGLKKATRYLPSLLADVNQHLLRLYQLLFQPLQADLAQNTTLIIAPDQTLHYVPFHALFNGAQYLLETHTLSYTPSATILDLCLTTNTAGQGALLYGYDSQNLAAVATELAMVKQLIPTAHIHMGDSSSAASFLKKAAQYRLLHLATHAKFRMDKPLLSSLALADRQLTLAEIARLQLNADLVILSGCETGHGQLRGADLLSLAGGFLSAGASSLLVSLWRVEDTATAQLMAAFYRTLLAGESRATALQKAQQAMLTLGRQATDEQQMYSHPAYWAPFTLIGNWQPIDGITIQ